MSAASSLLLTQAPVKTINMEWSSEHDVILCREILATEPYKAKPRTMQRGVLWNSVVEHLNEIDKPQFIVTKRGVRDRYNLLKDKFKRQKRVHERASGIHVEQTELDTLLEEIVEREQLHESNYENSENESTEKKKDAGKDMRLKAMESLGESLKRKSTESDGDVEKKIKKARSKSSDAIEYLQYKNEKDMEFRQQELDLQKKSLENEKEKQMFAERRQQEMSNMMQAQMQQSQTMQVQFVQLMQTLAEKLSNK